eukprot:1349793-Rhodomonas_salina.2
MSYRMCYGLNRYFPNKYLYEAQFCSTKDLYGSKRTPIMPPRRYVPFLLVPGNESKLMRPKILVLAFCENSRNNTTNP